MKKDEFFQQGNQQVCLSPQYLTGHIQIQRPSLVVSTTLRLITLRVESSIIRIYSNITDGK